MKIWFILWKTIFDIWDKFQKIFSDFWNILTLEDMDMEKEHKQND